MGLPSALAVADDISAGSLSSAGGWFVVEIAGSSSVIAGVLGCVWQALKTMAAIVLHSVRVVMIVVLVNGF